MITGDDDAHLELRFSPNQPLYAPVRRFLWEFYEGVLRDPAVASRLCLATHELIENAISYSADGHTSVSIDVRRLPDGLDVAIDTTNRASEANQAVLEGYMSEMSAASDAAAHYLTLMRRTVKRTEGSGLGLGRIRAETDMDLSYRIEFDTVHVSARARYPAAPPA